MYAEELMIGDLVYDTLSQTYIKANRRCFETSPLNGICYVENLSTIPLTSEILVKNGFRVVYEDELHVCYFQDIGRFHVEIKVDRVGIFHKLSMWDGLGNKVTIVECRFVHQLQHALRLLGIEKTIEL